MKKDGIPRVVVLGTRGFPGVQGGVEAHCENLYPIIAKHGWDITVLTRRDYVDTSISNYRKVRLISLSCPKNKFLEAIIHTFKGIWFTRKIGCDILHIHAIGPSLCVPLARLLRLKVVVTHHGPDYMRKKWNSIAKLFLKFGEMCACKYANEVICISQTIADSIRDKFGIDSVVIPNGVVIPKHTIQKGLLKRFGLEKQRYFIAVGRFVPEKGFIDLLEAFALFKRETHSSSKGVKLVIVGASDHEDSYSLSIKKRASQIEDVVLTGKLKKDALAELYYHAHTFVMPSYYEGLPIALLEAMSYGLPCIVSDIPANREVKLEGNRYFKPGDVEAIYGGLCYAVQSPFSEQQRLQQIDFVRKHFNWEEIANQTIKVYERLCC